ncbi:F-type H+-transporting ATPase subunit gamma [Halomonas fontilapidosi]|uniref:F-type H+-transporting ATPase subunit gamma n=1 Tax=Halomonas fontilapidosi TaxID=616675 RepID=A0A7W5DLD8_9GAMM|nr:F-type H+-transporting ATPase subunit gamma [Halomonas fontilapidosi]
MTQTLETLSRRFDTLTSIRGIVHTMKTISAINAVPYERAARSIEAYHRTVRSGLHAFVARTGPIAMPSVELADSVVVVFGSDHGLCGNYNELLAEKVAAELVPATAGHAALRVLCVGAQMHDALAGQGLSPESVLLPPASAEGIGRLAGSIVTRLDDIGGGEPHHRKVTLAFTQRAGRGQHEPVLMPLLPLGQALLSELVGRPWQSRSLPDYSMPSAELFAALLRSHIFASVFRASAEAMVTENAARLALMQQAEKSVDERLDEVKGQLRSVRQDEITTELLDVIIGFEALRTPSRRSPHQTPHPSPPNAPRRT